MNQCFKCKTSFPVYELKKFKSGRSYCPTCVLKSLYRCPHCQEKFLLGDFATDYDEGKKLAWKAKLEHEKTYHS